MNYKFIILFIFFPQLCYAQGLPKLSIEGAYQQLILQNKTELKDYLDYKNAKMNHMSCYFKVNRSIFSREKLSLQLGLGYEFKILNYQDVYNSFLSYGSGETKFYAFQDKADYTRKENNLTFSLQWLQSFGKKRSDGLFLTFGYHVDLVSFVRSKTFSDDFNNLSGNIYSLYNTLYEYNVTHESWPEFTWNSSVYANFNYRLYFKKQPSPLRLVLGCQYTFFSIYTFPRNPIYLNGGLMYDLSKFLKTKE